jgi:hypothetical protein
MEESKTAVEEEVARWFVPSPAIHCTHICVHTNKPLTIMTGFDLTGNTFWEFKDQINIGRIRRIVQYTNPVHYADVKVSRESPSPCPSHPPRPQGIQSGLTMAKHNGCNGSATRVQNHPL